MAENNPKIDLNDYFPAVPSDSPQVKNNPVKPHTPDVIRNYIDQQLPLVKQNSTNEFMKGKTEIFGADMNNHQFERYYSHPKFKQLGFNPYIDNETRYNENSGFFDDFSRTQAQWAKLVGLGASDAFGFGPSSDRKFAEEYDKAVKIGISNRGGLGGFVNNLYLNSGYTFGIMSEIIAEEIGLAIATAVTGGAAGELAIARTGANVSRLMKSLFTAAAWEKNINKVVKGIDALSDANVARNVWKGLREGAIGTGKFIGKQLVPESYSFLSNFNKLENLGGVARTATGFGSFYRDVRNVRLAYGESALEAGMVENELLESNYKKFMDMHGREPNEQEIDEIRNAAKQAAASTFMANFPVIYLSNGITMGTMMKSFSPIRRLAPIMENQFYKTVVTKEGLKVVEKGFKTAMKGFIQPKTYAKFSLDYFSANFAEGLQESAQEIISGANKDYYGNLYGSKTRGGYYDAVAANVAKQFSGQGLETFASGFFMGGLVGTVSGTVAAAKEYSLKFTDPKFQEKKEAAKTAFNQKVELLNEVYKNPMLYNNAQLNDLVEGSEFEKQMQEAQDKGDQKTFQSLKSKSLSSRLFTILEQGLENTFLERFNSLTSLTDQELTELYPEGGTAQEIRESIQNVSNKLQDFKKNYDFAMTATPNIFNPGKYSEGTPEHITESLNWYAFREAQKDLILSKEGFSNSIKRMGSIMSEAVKDVNVADITASDLGVLFSIDMAQQEITTLNRELQTLGTDKLVTPEAKKLKAEKERKVKNLTEFLDSMTEVVSAITPTEKEVNQEIGTGEGKIKFTKENFIKSSIYNKAFENYKKYIKGQAKGKPVFDANLEKAFEKLIDYYLLDIDSKNFTRSVNTLTNPKSLQEHVMRKKEVVEVEYNNRKQRIAQALDAYEKTKQKNVLLEALYKAGIFFDVEELDALEKEGKMPTRLYDLSGKDQILSTSSKYNEAVDIFKQYVENIYDIPLVYSKVLDNYDMSPREKFLGDERTYEDLAEQFGFDPKANKTVLPARKVLQTIAESDFATEAEIALALRLLQITKDSDTITFTKELAAPGIFTQDEQTVIDPRYSSDEFEQNAQSYALETSILREEVNRHLDGAVDKESDAYDEDFNNTINKIRSAAFEYFQANGTGLLPIGLKDNETFITEVMTNEKFRELLAQVEYPETNESTWKKFLNAVVDMLRQAFGNIPSNTALNAAVSAITSKIDARISESKRKAAGETVTGTKAVDPQRDLSIDEIRQQAPGLIDELIVMFKEYSKIFAEMDINNMPSDSSADYDKLTPEEIVKIPEFENYIRNNANERVVAAFSRYFTPKSDNVRVIPRTPGTAEAYPGIPLTIEETDKEIIDTEMRNQLKALDYTEAEIDELSIIEAVNIIAYGEKKGDTQARLAEMAEQIDYGTDLRKAIESNIKKISNYDEYEDFQEELAELQKSETNFWGATGFTAEELDTLMNEKLEELAYKVDFNDIKEGDTFVIIDPATGKTELFAASLSKTGKTVYLTSVKNPSYVKRLTSKQFETENANKYIFKYNPKRMKDLNLKSTTIDPSSVSTFNANKDMIDDLTDDDLTLFDDKGSKISADDALNNFLDSYNKACE